MHTLKVIASCFWLYAPSGVELWHTSDISARYYRPGAAPLILSQKTAMRLFSPKTLLDSTRLLVLARERVNNSPFYGELMKMGFEAGSLPDFAHMAAITFVGTVVSHEAFTDRLLFHVRANLVP